MNKNHEHPNFKENSWYPIGDAAKMLGIDRSTLRAAAERGRRAGGVDWKIGRNGRKKFSGKELNRYYNEM
ncbi:MAG: helix-turn-helix domain-containing protein [Candidatus Amulumruptor caecigallinarius]|nr:helix-turn-helix domain-containing protein [Candidatus Amulumruptor caecigallinarius]